MKNIFVCFPWAFSYDYMDKHDYADNRDFKIQRCHDNENVKRAKGLKSKTKLCTCITLFCTILCRFCTTENGEGKLATTKFLFSPLNLTMVLRNSPTEGFAYIGQSRWVRIVVTKIERTQIHFLSDVFTAVASSDLKVPNDDTFK